MSERAKGIGIGSILTSILIFFITGVSADVAYNSSKVPSLEMRVSAIEERESKRDERDAKLLATVQTISLTQQRLDSELGTKIVHICDTLKDIKQEIKNDTK